MKRIKVNFAILAFIIGSAFAVATSTGANASVKNLLFTAGWYEIPPSGTPVPEGSSLGTSDPESSVCTHPFTPNCVAEFDSNENLVSGTIKLGTFSN